MRPTLDFSAASLTRLRLLELRHAASLTRLQALESEYAAMMRPYDDPDRPLFYVPTPPAVVRGMLRLARVTRDDVVFDLGCGDGRLVVAAARLGARGVGIDIDPARIAEATARARRAGVNDRVTFLQGSLFDADVRSATVVCLYLFPNWNLRVLHEVFPRLRTSARVVTHDFGFGDCPPDAESRTRAGRSRVLRLFNGRTLAHYHRSQNVESPAKRNGLLPRVSIEDTVSTA